MLLIWGSRLYGKTDEVKGLFHVATKFGHLWYLPLLPLGSHVILAQDANGWRGVPIGLNLKSWLLTWMRLGLFACAAFLILPAVAVLIDTHTRPDFTGPALSITFGALFLGAWAWFMFGKWTRRASYQRAHQLGELVGLNERGRILIDLAYGIITEQEAQAALAQLADTEQVNEVEATI